MILGDPITFGGTGGLSPNAAVIHVTAPVGSTISFSKGGIVAKVLGPDKSHVNAEDNTLADWYYAVSSSNYGTWTVTATLGTDTASNTVAIDSNKEYEVALVYRQYIIKNGRFQNGYSFSLSLRSGHAPTITENYNDTGYLQMGMVNAWSTGGVTDSIDIAAYQNLCAEAYKSGGSSYVGVFPGYGYGSQSAIESAAVAKTAVQEASSLLTVDISGLTGSYYIGGSIGHNSNSYYLFIADMWLE